MVDGVRADGMGKQTVFSGCRILTVDEIAAAGLRSASLIPSRLNLSLRPILAEGRKTISRCQR